MSVCGSNRLTIFSCAGTVSPPNTRRRVWPTTRASSASYAATSSAQDDQSGAPRDAAATCGSAAEA